MAESSQNPVSYPIDIGYLETQKGLKMDTHFHNFYEIIYILEGKVQFSINNKNYEVKENNLIFISNLESHELRVLEYPYRRYFIRIKPDYLQSIVNEPVLVSIFKNRPNHFKHVLVLNSQKQLEIINIIKAMHQEVNEKKSFWETALKSSLYMLFVSLYRDYKDFFPLTSINKSMNNVLEIQKYVEDHCTEQISLSEISSVFFMDMFYLSHQFKKVTGFTFKEYLILQRLSKAKDFLFYTAEDITQVGMNSGFNNVNHFIRIFKKFEGTTPHQYRKKCRDVSM